MKNKQENNTQASLNGRRVSLSGRQAFTLIELLIVIAIVGIIASIVITMTTQAKQKAHGARNASQLEMIAKALNVYYTQFAAYPVSDGWQGYCSHWGGNPGGYLSDNWIPELYTSNVISTPHLPTDTRQEGNGAPCIDDQKQYIYFSDGTNFKLISVTNDSLLGVPPNLIDPIRPTDAFGFWSDGGATW